MNEVYSPRLQRTVQHEELIERALKAYRRGGSHYGFGTDHEPVEAKCEVKANLHNVLVLVANGDADVIWAFRYYPNQDRFRSVPTVAELLAMTDDHYNPL